MSDSLITWLDEAEYEGFEVEHSSRNVLRSRTRSAVDAISWAEHHHGDFEYIIVQAWDEDENKIVAVGVHLQ